MAQGSEHSEYWNPKNETMPRGQLQALQLTKLRRHTEWAYSSSPFHRRRFDEARFHPDQLKTLDDIRRIPFMTREEWMQSIADNPMFGALTADLVTRRTVAPGEPLALPGGLAAELFTVRNEVVTAWS